MNPKYVKRRDLALKMALYMAIYCRFVYIPLPCIPLSSDPRNNNMLYLYLLLLTVRRYSLSVLFVFDSIRLGHAFVFYGKCHTGNEQLVASPWSQAGVLKALHHPPRGARWAGFCVAPPLDDGIQRHPQAWEVLGNGQSARCIHACVFPPPLCVRGRVSQAPCLT